MDTPTADKRMILEALGWKAAHDENEDRWILYSPDGARFNSTSFRDTDSEAPEHIFDPVEIDANFCFANIVPFMADEGFQFGVSAVSDETESSGYGCYFHRFHGIKNSDGEPDIESHEGIGPTVEAAIRQAFISYWKEQQV